MLTPRGRALHEGLVHGDVIRRGGRRRQQRVQQQHMTPQGRLSVLSARLAGGRLCLQQSWDWDGCLRDYMATLLSRVRFDCAAPHAGTVDGDFQMAEGVFAYCCAPKAG